MTKAVKTRTYDASRRRAQARETELAVLRAAVELFVAQGYVRTTLAEIARVADVSVETIYARFKTKPRLLHRAWDITIGGDDEEVMFHERPAVLAIRSEPDLAKRMTLHAAFITTIARRTGPFMLMLQGAASADAEAAELLAEVGRQRLAGMTIMAEEANKTGRLAVSVEECRDIVWSLTDAMLWHRLVVERGWSDDRFSSHLATILTASLVR